MNNESEAASRDAADKEHETRTESLPSVRRSAEQPDVTGIRRSLSRDNPFVADGELSRAADLILASSTFSRLSISVVDPDLESSCSVSIPSEPPCDPKSIASTTISLFTTTSGSPRHVSFADYTHAPIHTTTHANTEATTNAFTQKTTQETTEGAITQETIKRTIAQETTQATTTHVVAQETTHETTAPATIHVSIPDPLKVASDDTSEVVAMASVQHRILDEVVKVTLDRSQEITTTYIPVRGHGTDTSSESDTSTPEAEDTKISGSEEKLPVCQEYQAQDGIVSRVSFPLKSQGRVENLVTVCEHRELQGEIQGHGHGYAKGRLDDIEWVDADDGIEQKSLLTDVMSALEMEGFGKNVWMIESIGKNKGLTTFTGNPKSLENVSKGVVKLQPKAVNDELTRTEELTLKTGSSVQTGTEKSKTQWQGTETSAGKHTMETVPNDACDIVKPRMNDEILRKIDVNFVIESENNTSGTVLTEAGQFASTALEPSRKSPESSGPEQKGPMSDKGVPRKGAFTEDRATDTARRWDCDTPDRTQRAVSCNGEAPVKSLKRKILCCSVQ